MPERPLKAKQILRRPLTKAFEEFYKGETGKALSREIQNCLLVNWPAEKASSFHLLCAGFPPRGLKDTIRASESVGVFSPKSFGAFSFTSNKKNVSLVGDETRLPFRPGSYDRAIVIHALEYMDDPEWFLQDLWKVLSPGGQILVMVPNRSGAWKKTGVPSGNQTTAFVHGDTRGLLQRAGFRVTDSYGVLYGVPVGFFRKILFSGLLKAVSGGTIAGFPAFLMFFAEKETGPQKIRLKEPMKIIPGARPAPKLSPE